MPKPQAIGRNADRNPNLKGGYTKPKPIVIPNSVMPTGNKYRAKFLKGKV